MKKYHIFIAILLPICLSLQAQEAHKFIRMPIGGGLGVLVGGEDGATIGWDLHAGIDYYPFKRITALNDVFIGADFRYESYTDNENRFLIYGKIGYKFNIDDDSENWFYGGLRHALSFGKESFNDKFHYEVISNRYLVAEPFFGVQKGRYTIDINLMMDYRIRHVEDSQGKFVSTKAFLDTYGLYLRINLFLF